MLQGSSPDEIELVSMAAKMKFEFITKTAEVISLKISDTIQVILIFEFDSSMID